MKNQQTVYSWQAIRHWLAKPIGEYYMDVLKTKLSTTITTLFGYHLLIIGEPELSSCVTASPIMHHVLVHQHQNSERNIYSFCCAKQDKLPFATESIDLIYIAHALETASNPVEILHEAYRVLRPEGKLIIAGFNPISLFGLYCSFGKLFGHTLGAVKFITKFKLKDWLELSGFSLQQSSSLFYALPINNESILKNMSIIEKLAGKFKLPFSAAYLIMATKRVITLTPIKPKFCAEPMMVTNNLAEPAKYQFNE